MPSLTAHYQHNRLRIDAYKGIRSSSSKLDGVGMSYDLVKFQINNTSHVLTFVSALIYIALYFLQGDFFFCLFLSKPLSYLDKSTMDVLTSQPEGLTNIGTMQRLSARRIPSQTAKNKQTYTIRLRILPLQTQYTDVSVFRMPYCSKPSTA